MRLGVVTGLRIEAGRFQAANSGDLIASGAGKGGREACRRLLEAGAQALLGFGLAGGLKDEFEAGEIVVASAIRLPSGAEYACDGAWQCHLEALLRRQTARVHVGPLFGADYVAATPAEKRALMGSGALAVDTESHHLATAASRAGLPFAVVRVVVDRVQDRLPSFLANAYGEDGRLQLSAVLGGLLRQPGELTTLLRLSRQSRLALATLGRVGRLGPALGPP